jgi:Fe-S cluster assembly protein SufB
MSSTSTTAAALEAYSKQGYLAGFETAIEQDCAPPGLSEDIVRFISAKKDEPEWMTAWRLKAYRHWLTMTQPDWPYFTYGPIDYQAISYYAAPKKRPGSLDEVDPEILATYQKLGIPLQEQKILAGVEDAGDVPADAKGTSGGASGGNSGGNSGGKPVAVDAVFDSVSVKTTFQKALAQAGVIFCSISEAVRHHPELVQKYLGSVVPYSDNYFATLNSAVFSDGSFVYIPPGVDCPMELSTYFRINARGTGQFERTLVIADRGAKVSYLEGCTAPMRDENQLHAAVVELVALDDAFIKYSTIQNWYPGDPQTGKGGIYNFVTKRGLCGGPRSRISWTQLETGSAITWKYPSCILKGDDAVGEFYSVAVTNHHQMADTGTKMIHLGKRTKSTIISKGISAGQGQNVYRGLVRVNPGAEKARNYTQCDSMLIGDRCGAHTFPYIDVRNATARTEHEATTSKIGEDQLFYLQQRGISTQDAVSLIVNGFCKQVLSELPMEFAVEANKLLSISLEGSVG